MIDFSKIPSPSYVIDEVLLRKNLELIKDISKRVGVEILLALKGFAMWKAFPVIREYINGAAVSSVNEAKLANEEMHCKTHTYAPVYQPDSFNEVIKYSSHITFNSIKQFKKFLPEIKKSKNNISVGLRINPEYSAVESGLYNPCSPGSRLGILAENMPKELPNEIEGLHIHNLCESDSFALEKTLQAIEDKFGKYFNMIKWINLGGGHLMTKKGYNVMHLISILKSFQEKYKFEIILEPGAAFVWETGYLVSTILDIVENKKTHTAILDVSFTAHMPDCLEMPYKPEIIGAMDEVIGKPTYRIGGSSCLAGDYTGNWSFDKKLEIGQKIIFKDMIHYTMVKTSMFNGVNHPSIGMWTKDNKFELFREFGYEDYKNRLC
ncbi:carboxynorspermidine decarboxylase [Bacteroidota bacterium]